MLNLGVCELVTVMSPRCGDDKMTAVMEYICQLLDNATKNSQILHDDVLQQILHCSNILLKTNQGRCIKNKIGAYMLLSNFEKFCLFRSCLYLSFILFNFISLYFPLFGTGFSSEIATSLCRHQFVQFNKGHKSHIMQFLLSCYKNNTITDQ